MAEFRPRRSVLDVSGLDQPCGVAAACEVFAGTSAGFGVAAHDAGIAIVEEPGHEAAGLDRIEFEAAQAKILGMSGKCLRDPTDIDAINRIFEPGDR